MNSFIFLLKMSGIKCHSCGCLAQFQEAIPNPRYFCGKECQLIAGKKRERSEEEEEDESTYTLAVKVWNRARSNGLVQQAHDTVMKIVLDFVRKGIIEPDFEPGEYPFDVLFPKPTGDDDDVDIIFWNAQAELVVRLQNLEEPQDDVFEEYQIQKTFPYRPEIHPNEYTDFVRRAARAWNPDTSERKMVSEWKKHLKTLLYQSTSVSVDKVDTIERFIDARDVSKSAEFEELKKLWPTLPSQ